MKLNFGAVDFRNISQIELTDNNISDGGEESAEFITKALIIYQLLREYPSPES
jgi:hypothetical protein